MRCKIDLTGKKYLGMEYLFVSTAAVQVTEQLADPFELLIYGFIYHTDHHEFPELKKQLPARLTHPLPDAMAYAGWAKLSFEGVQGGSLRVCPYKPRFGPCDRDFMTHDGEIVKLIQEWPVNYASKRYEYILECSLEQPLGAMRLVLHASGTVTLSVDPNQFYMDGEQHEWYDETRQRLLHSID